MTRQIINYGAFDNDGTGDTPRAAFKKTDDNFAELYGRGATISLNSIAAVKAQNWSIGDVAALDLYGGCFGRVIATPVLDALNEAVDFDDELNIVVNLSTGGTGMMTIAATNIIGWLRRRFARNTAGSRLALNTAVASGERVKIAIRSDSKGYGQNSSAPLSGGARIATGFGDKDFNFKDANGVPAESKHVWGAIASPYPQQVQAYLRTMMDSDGAVIDVVNGGYSGDRWASSYRRHTYFATDARFDVFPLGLNDVLFSTSNGVTPVNAWNGNAWSIQQSTDVVMQTIARSIIRGAVPIIMLPAAIRAGGNDPGFDGSYYAVNKILMLYKAAWRRAAEIFGVTVIDEQEGIGRHPLADTTQDNIHPTVFGASLDAVQVTAAIAWEAYGSGRKIFGPDSVMANVSITPVIGLAGKRSGNIPTQSDTKGLSRPFSGAQTSENILLTEGSKRYVVLWLETDEMHIMPVGRTEPNTGTGRTFTLYADFGVANPYYALARSLAATQNARGAKPPVGRNFSDATVDKAFHHEDQFGGHVMLMGRGPHIVSVEVPLANPVGSGGMKLHLDGFRLGHFGDWQPLPLFSGFVQEGDIEAAWRYTGGRIEYRGLVRAATPAATGDQAVFGYPAGINLLPSLSNLTSRFNDVVFKFASGIGTKVGPSTSAVFDLSDYRQNITSTPGV